MNEFWVDRSEEGRALAERLQAGAAPISVLYGAADSGKTDFIRDCVMPLIPRSSYRNADLSGLEKVSAGEFLFVDSFEEFLRQPDASRSVAPTLRMAERQSFKIALLVEQDYLNRLFQLQQEVPRLMEAAIELPSIEEAQLFDTFLNALHKREVQLSEELRKELASDLEGCSAKLAVDPELFAILAAEFQRMQKAGRETGKNDYEAAGRLLGILESHVESVFDEASNRFDPQMCWAVLEAIARNSTGDDSDLTDVANRFDVPRDVAVQAVDWLEKSTTLVRNDKLGRRVVRPRQLSVVIETRRQREIDADEHLALMLRQGVRHFIDTATCLSESSFRKIHARRSTIRASEDEARLMLRCALAYEDARSAQATDHWLKRLQNPDAAVEILMDSTYDAQAETRQRAVARLGGFNRPEVRHLLHMLALRDPVEDVRSQAIESLAPLKDDSLRNALIQEVNDSRSPYRLQAIETLRIFNDQETIQTLVKIARDGASAHPEAREKAIQVLGRQDAVQPGDALLKLALEEDDWRTRHDAASALGSMQSEEPLQSVLEKLRLQKPGVRRNAAPRSLLRVLTTPVYVVAAAAVILLTFLVHGLLLATLRRWRLAIAVTIVEVVGFVLLLTPATLAGVWVIVATLVTGLLVPTRIVLIERRDSGSHGWYRRCVDILLAIVDSFTFFLVFPGLAPLLSGNVRRGLTLIGVGVAGVGLVLGALFFQDQFAAFVPISSVFTIVPQSMIIIGGVLVAIAYISGLGSTLFNSFLGAEKREWIARQEAVYLEFLTNPPAARIVAAKLTSDKPDESAWAASLIRRYRPLFQRSIQKDSVELLKTAVPSKGWRVTLEYLRAAGETALSTLPKIILAAGLAGVLTLVAFSAVLYQLFQNTPQRLMGKVHDQTLAASERSEGVARLRILALAEDRQEFAAEALTKTVLQEGIDDSLRAQVRQALKEVADKRIDERHDIIKPLGEALSDRMTTPEIQKSIIATLGELQLLEGAVALRDFIERPPVDGRGKQNPGTRSDPDLDTKLAAVDAIRDMNVLGHEAYEILTNIQQNGILAKKITDAAEKAIAEFDPLSLAETDLALGKYTDAVRHGEAAIQKFTDQPRIERARKVLGTSHLRLGSMEWRDDNFEKAKAHFNEALKYVNDENTVAAEIDLGLDLAFMAHETIALNNPQGYMETYELAMDLRKLEAPSSKSRITIESNLAEANLTVGKYDEAANIADAIVKDPALGKDNETRINMLLIGMAARLLKGDERGAAQTRRDLLNFYNTLDKGFSNGWSYEGTEHYIETSHLSDEQKREITSLIMKIRSK